MLLSCEAKMFAGRILLPLGAGLIMLSYLMKTPAQAQTFPPASTSPPTITFVVSVNEGYGVMECLIDGIACGQVVADSFCESRGKGTSVAFGLASDITGSTQASSPVPVKISPGDVIITCRE